MGKAPRNIPAEHAALVRQIAYDLVRRLPSHVSVDELISAGWLGYLEAWEKFDSGRGSAFETYAKRRIHGAMLDELRSRDPLGRDTRLQYTRLRELTALLQNELMRDPTDEELAKRAEMPVAKVEELLALQDKEYLDDPQDPAGILHQLSASEVGEEERLIDFQDALQVAREIDQALKCLSSRLERVMRAYYFEELKEREIGQRLGVTESRVCQMLAKGLHQLRSVYEAIAKAEQALRRQPTAAVAADRGAVPEDAFVKQLSALEQALDDAIIAESSLEDDPKKGS